MHTLGKHNQLKDLELADSHINKYAVLVGTNIYYTIFSGQIKILKKVS